MPGWNYLYQFDQIGNRNTATVNGRFSIYMKNSLNQITSRTVPRGFDVLGKASTTASVTVDGQPATRLYEYFHRPITTGTGAVHVPYSVTATDANGTTTRSGGKFLPASPEASTYDFDGNLTSDGRFTYVWDAENRLVSMETHATVPVPARRKLAFAYDGGSRRIRKTVWHGNAGGTWDFKYEHRFVHELGGWNIQAELKADGSFLRTYVWGTDLSGNFSGAGGVGGLLFTNILADKTTHAHGYDLNGNVTLLVNAATGESTATYDYGPFGEPIRESGEYAKLDPHRFSTKYTDDETGLLDYGYRYYDPVTGRWPSRDPIGERGGRNLYGFVGNDGVTWWDYLGLKRIQKIITTAYWSGSSVAVVVKCCDGKKPDEYFFGPSKPDSEGCCEFGIDLNRFSGYKGSRGGAQGTDVWTTEVGEDPSLSRVGRRKRAVDDLLNNIEKKVSSHEIPGIGECRFLRIVRENSKGEPDPAFIGGFKERISVEDEVEPKPNPLPKPQGVKPNVAPPGPEKPQAPEVDPNMNPGPFEQPDDFKDGGF